MSWSKPQPQAVWEAIELYLGVAYSGGKPPSAVEQRLATLRNLDCDDFFASPLFERDAGAGGSAGAGGGAGGANPEPTRYAIRLGNRHYPHMKMVVERSPDGRAHLFRADTHDRHIRPKPESREYAAFTELMRQNQALAEQIEAAWAERGLNTFKSYLRRDLAARQQHSQQPPRDASPGRA
jgi:hypothetical protein